LRGGTTFTSRSSRFRFHLLFRISRRSVRARPGESGDRPYVTGSASARKCNRYGLVATFRPEPRCTERSDDATFRVRQSLPARPVKSVRMTSAPRNSNAATFVSLHISSANPAEMRPRRVSGRRDRRPETQSPACPAAARALQPATPPPHQPAR